MRLQHLGIGRGEPEMGASATIGTENAAGTAATTVSYEGAVLFDGLSIRPK